MIKRGLDLWDVHEEPPTWIVAALLAVCTVTWAYVIARVIFG